MRTKKSVVVLVYQWAMFALIVWVGVLFVADWHNEIANAAAWIDITEGSKPATLSQAMDWMYKRNDGRVWLTKETDRQGSTDPKVVGWGVYYSLDYGCSDAGRYRADVNSAEVMVYLVVDGRIIEARYLQGVWAADNTTYLHKYTLYSEQNNGLWAEAVVSEGCVMRADVYYE